MSEQKRKFREIVLPSGLQQKVTKQYLAAFFMTIVIITFAVYYREARYLFALFIPSALIYLGVSTSYAFDEGNIIEVAVICTSVNTYRMRDTTHVTFRTNDDPPKYYNFILPGKTEKIFPNSGYIIYFNCTQPDRLIGYTPV